MTTTNILDDRAGLIKIPCGVIDDKICTIHIREIKECSESWGSNDHECDGCHCTGSDEEYCETHYDAVELCATGEIERIDFR